MEKEPFNIHETANQVINEAENDYIEELYDTYFYIAQIGLICYF